MLLPFFYRQIRTLPWLTFGLLGNALTGHAQAPSSPALVLKPSSLLEESILDNTRKQLPTFLQSDTLSGRPDLETNLNGQVVIRRGDMLIKADKVDYDQVDDFAKARGNVYINRSGNVYQGPALDIYVDAFEGFFTQPSYQLLKNKAYGKAERIDFIDPANSVMHKADFTTCQRKPGPNWTLRFKDVPILPVPSIDFPLSDERKSGLLPPTIGVDNIGGLEYTQPYYWNLAPNRDITFFPTYWSNRGMRLGTEFRYLEGLAPVQPPFQGQMRFDYMEKDALREGSRRWGMQYSHVGLVNPAYAGGALGLNVNVNRVSDDDYWKDFAIAGGSGVQRLLSNDVGLNWTNGIYTYGMRSQTWQTLQDLANIYGNRITPPFNRAPQFTARMQRINVEGFDFSIDGDLTRFESAREYECANGTTFRSACSPNADRAVGLAQISRPFTTPYGYLTPKAQINSRSYQFAGGLPNNPFYSDGGHAGQSGASVTVPTFSIDTGVAFEKSTRLFDRSWVQTFEPRMFYVYTPYRDQNYLPNYDSGGNSFNFASIFTENAFGGYDRISDSKLLTIGATSRFIDPETGAEGARFGLAQRLRMREQRVTMPDDVIGKTGVSDLLAGASVALSKAWAIDSTVQYNQKTENFMRRMVSGRYNPGSYRVVSAGYRTENDESGGHVARQVDIGWQWPLHDLWGGADTETGDGRGLGEGRWYSVARMNYNPLDKKMVESVMGFEYDAGCWLGRVVGERLQVTETLASKRLLFQLEFVGFSRIGTNAMGSLKANVPRYQPLRQPSMTPSRFGNYD
jgi:LPS-assembly protein